MKKQESSSFLRDEVTKNSSSRETSKDWKKVLFEIIIKILTLGFYHIEKHKK